MNDTFEILENRAVISLSGPDRKTLLQGIITSNIDQLQNGIGLYAALLTPQGKFLHDFFLYEKDDTIYLDCEKDSMAQLFQKLLMYRLRSNVEILDRSEEFKVITSPKPIAGYDISYPDPRHKEMGYRAIVSKLPSATTMQDYHNRRIKLGIAEGTHDFIAGKSTILEGHLEELNGVDFEKGCYVGQEVIARMKYRGKVSRIMLPFSLSGPAPEFGTAILDEKGNKIGDLRSHCGKNAIGNFRVRDVIFEQQYACGDINITVFKPEWMKNSSDE